MNELSVKKLNSELGPNWAVSLSHLEMKSGECALVIGENGTGKSTLLRVLAGLYPFGGGEVQLKVAGKYIKPHEWRDYVSFLPETFHFPPKTRIEDSLKYFLRLRGLSSHEAMEKIAEYTKVWRLNQYLKENSNECSIGILQQLKIALVLMNPTPLIILDEPLESLDPRARKNVWRQLQTCAEEGIMFLISIFTDWADAIKPNQIIRMKAGKGVASEEIQKVLKEYEEDLAHS